MPKQTDSLVISMISTGREYDNGAIHRCLDSYFGKNTRSKHKVDIFVFLNCKLQPKHYSLMEYEKHRNVGSINVVGLDLPPLEDIYIRPCDVKDSTILPPLGLSSGPNLLFYKSMGLLTKYPNYQNILLLETDTYPASRHWLDGLVRTCKSEDFLICGSIYKGDGELPLDEPWTGHLNGVGIYRNCSALEAIIQKSIDIIKMRVAKSEMKMINFDVALFDAYNTLCIQKKLRPSVNRKNRMIDSDIIANFSLPCDEKLTTKEILRREPKALIIHKKW